MKYLKRFSETLNESSSNESHADDIIENIKDILLPINDMGYGVSVQYYIINGDTSQLVIRVVSWGDKALFITDEVKEEFTRMRDYLQSEGYDSITAKFYLEDRSQNEKDINDFLNIKEPIANLLFDTRKKLKF